MKAATYSRYSTKMQDESSIDRQQRVCAERAEREGWKIIAQYKDEAISGQKDDRHSYLQMLADAKAKAFDVLLVEDLSRMTRNDDTSRTIKRLKFWGVRVVGVSDGFDSDSKSHKIQAGFRGLQNEMYIDDLAEKTHNGQAENAHRGDPTGGKAYGYKTIYTQGTDKKTGRPVLLPVKREQESEQAKWALQIFEWYAAGHSPRWIAGELNRQGVPSPGSTWKRVTRRCSGWLDSAVRGILQNPLYAGEVIWNRSDWEKDPDTGKKHRRERPEHEWIRREDKTLRIVSPELWARTQARLNERTAIGGNQHPDIRPRQKFLFSGLLKCAQCGGNFVIADAYRYACNTHVNGGEHLCANSLRVPRTLVEQKLLAGIKHDLFTTAELDLFKRRTTALLAAHRQAKRPDTEGTRRALAEAEKAIGCIVEAIKAGAFSEQLKAELAKLEADRVRLTAALKVDTRQLDKVAEFLPRVVDRFRALTQGLETVAQRDVARARAQLRGLLGEIRLAPSESGVYLEAELAGDYAGLFKLASNGANLNLYGSGGRI